jgi:hemerythrin-like domain-containing protein
MVQYIDRFPERLHHPKEDKYLFALLRQRTADADAVLDELEAQHVHGAKLIRDLEWTLVNWENKGATAFAEFARRVREYSEFHWKHMRQEEDVVLPLAERVLTAQDWSALDIAFEGNRDPLIGVEVQQDFDKLFSRIVNLAPPPIGLGPEPQAHPPTRK